MGGNQSTPPPQPPPPPPRPRTPDPPRFRPENHVFPNGTCRFLILGKTGTGKSSTGNMLLGRKLFEVKGSFEGETELCQRGSAQFFNTTLEQISQCRKEQHRTGTSHRSLLPVIDTPGLFHPSKGTEWAEDIIAKGLASLDPGPNIILVTISCRNRFTEEEKKAFDIIRELMGSNAKDYMIIVFTGADELDMSIEHNIASRNKANPENKTMVAEVTRYAGAHYVTFNNKLAYTSEARDKQIDELLKIAKKIVATNPREHFCNTMSEKITEIVKNYVAEECRNSGKSEKEIRDKMKDDVLVDGSHPVMQAIRQ